MYPEDLRYTKEHEWAKTEGDLVRVGITHFAQDSLGDIVYVDIPGPGTRVGANQPFGEVESTKSVSDLYAPVGGEIVERNPALEEAPELVNQDPYGKGWMVLIRPTETGEVESLLSASDYKALVEAQG
ncbi:MAG TPA: glycine cleavage system protein GcvH [Actinomycetota bacterium]|nr:glycine cleavage system protein GcvH [Actinomycetota bacterium]